MKTYSILQVLALMLTVLTANAQQGINYKAIIHDANDDALVNTTVTVQFTILENGTTNVYQESHNPATDANGIIIVNIGEGTLVSGDFSAIDWGSNPHFLKTEIDIGEGLTDMGTTEFKAVPYSLYAKTAESVSDATTYSVGDFAQGGVVFWLDATGQHGLVCAKEDQANGISWGIDEWTDAYKDGLFTGEDNTAKIIHSYQKYEAYPNYPAYICDNLIVSEGGEDYAFWYLPSKDELYLMYKNRTTIDAVATANGGSAFSDDFYWSSTEVRYDHAWGYIFVIGQQNPRLKRGDGGVRAISAF